MPQFSYVGIDEGGARVTGTLDSASRLEAYAKLESIGVNPISINEVKERGLLSSGRKKVSRKDLITFTFQMEQLLSAGVPLLSVLDSLRQSFEEPGIKEIISAMLEDLKTGQTLSEAMAKHPKVFSPVYISLVQVGEQTGRLEAIFKDLAEMLRWEDELAAKAKKIMIYPTIVLVVVTGVVITLMVFVVPQLLNFIKEMGGELGFATRSLIFTSEFISEHIFAILITPILIFLAIREARKRHPGFKKWSDCNVFKIPIIGEIIYKLKLARLANSLAVMYTSGLPFTDSMTLAKKVLNTQCLEERLDKAHDLIQEGRPIHKAFQEANVFPILAIYMMEAGEKSGRMDEALRNVSYFFDRDAKELIEKVEPAIEPILTIILAGLVLWIMMAVLAPVYDTISQIQF